MLHAASTKRQRLSYFQNLKSSYDDFINKIWIERKNIFEVKNEYIFWTNKKWNSLNDKERSKFIATAPTPSKAKNKITTFFKSVAKKRTNLLNVLIVLRKVVKVPVMRLMSTFLTILQTQLLH